MFRRLFQKKIPKWAPFQELEHYLHFINLAKKVVKSKHHKLDRGAIRKGVYLIGVGKRWYLKNIAGDCFHQRDQNRWNQLIETDFNRALKGESRSDSEESDTPLFDSLFQMPDNPPGGWSRENMRLQLMSRNYLETQRVDIDALMGYWLTEEIFVALMANLRGVGVEIVTRTEALSWEILEEELFEIAGKNGVASDFDGIQMKKRGAFDGYINNGFYLGSCILQKLKSADPECDFLIGLPTWHHCFLGEIKEGDQVEPLISELKKYTEERYNRCTISHEQLTTTLYRYNQKSGFQPVAFKEVEGEIRF